jgi:TRAP-type transport system periplasmic protein
MLFRFIMLQFGTAVSLGLLSAINTTPVTAQQRATMATEYPATSMAGEGMARFIAASKARATGDIDITPSYDAALGIKSADMLTAVKTGKVAFGDAFLPALAHIDPLFGLSALPCLASSFGDARRLADAARPAYAAALARQGVRLLYLVPWPASGIWSKTAPNTDADLKALRLRTYDPTSTRVMADAGTKAELLSFADTMPRLKDGTIDGVLSSGDGGAGRKLWDYLPNFLELNYAFPLSIGVVSETVFAALSDKEKTNLSTAATHTERALWDLVQTRTAENYVRMRSNGVTIATTVSPEVSNTLRTACAPATRTWVAATGDDGAKLLEAYLNKRATKP